MMIVCLTSTLGCGQKDTQNLIGGPYNGTTLPPLSGPNVLQLTVNGSLCTKTYLNKPCVSLTICSVDGTQCQTVNDILLDTGSYGLRVFRSVLNSAVAAGLQPITVEGQAVAECVQYGDGSSDWGPVELASITLGNESAIQVPIQVIDSSFSNSSSNFSEECAHSNQNPTQAGYNGLLGIGFFAQDCGKSCVSQPNNGFYYRCSESQCTGTAIPLEDQVHNPVTLLPIDNNGVILMLPSVAPGGQDSANGYLVLGIGTQSNNIPTHVTSFPANPNTGDFTTEFNHISYNSFLDTGSNGLYFPSGPGPDCGAVSNHNSGWYCPSSTQTLNAVHIGYGEQPLFSLQFQIGNFTDLLHSGNKVFAEIGGSGNGIPTFDWGLPFFLGRNVYVGFQNKTSSLGTGPYWAY